MDTPEPQIVEFLQPVELQVDDFKSFVQDLKRVARSQQPADRHVVIDLGDLSALPRSYVKAMLKVHKLFSKQGRRLLVRANRDLRRALRSSTYGRGLQFEVGTSDPRADTRRLGDAGAGPAVRSRKAAAPTCSGYTLRANRLTVHDTLQDWRGSELAELVMSLAATREDPAILDLSELEVVTDGDLRRCAHAALHAQLHGHPVRIHALETHAGMIEELGIDRLLDVQILDLRDQSGLFAPTGGVRVDSARLDALLQEKTELPEKVINKVYTKLGTGSYRKLAAHAEAQKQAANFEESTDGISTYVGPDHRKTDRFQVADALLEVLKKSGGESEPSELVDLSESGGQIFSEVKMFLGEAVTLTLDIPDFVGELKLTGKVVWVNETEPDEPHQGYHVGLRFTRMPAGSMIKLRRLEGIHTAE